MNPHIELVRKWLADPESVSNKELKSNAYDAAGPVTSWASASYAACDAAFTAFTASSVFGASGPNAYYNDAVKNAVQAYDELIEKGE